MLQLGFTKLDGGTLTDAKGFGKPTLIVNTASECGFTPQYADLQALWTRYRDRGLVVLGVPSNDFGAQEPGDADAIREFCAMHYRVSFPMAAKAAILDASGRHPFYQSVAEALGEEHLPRWNFHKYLVDAHGELVGAWPSRVSPLAPEIIRAIEELLEPR